MDKPVGLNVPVRKMQEYIHRELLKKWGVEVMALYHSHGLCYRNKKDNGYVAEIFISDNSQGEIDYKETYWDDNLTAISFFGTDTKTTFDLDAVNKIHLVYFVNLNKIKPTAIHRADIDVQRDLISLFKTVNYGFSLNSVETGIENVLREYPGSYRDTKLKVVDMHPVHCFRLNFTLITNIKNCY